MPFLIYQRSPGPDGLEVVQKLKQVPFGGNRQGLLFRFLKALGRLEATPEPIPPGPRSPGPRVIPWQASVGEILQATGFDPEHHRLIVDLKPGVKDNVSLYEVRHVWGVSYPAWTPLMIELRALFIDVHVPPEEKNRCKQTFLLDPEGGEPIFDFVYLRGGHQEGTWNPGQLGAYSGVLLWPETARFFSDAMRERLASQETLGKPDRHRLSCLEKL